VLVISADRRVGKSFFRRRVREMWWFCGWFELLGVRERVQASLGRKSGAEGEVDNMEGVVCDADSKCA
jgi:hypothetical protein